jgi:hypothetical protein
MVVVVEISLISILTKFSIGDKIAIAITRSTI